MDSVVLNWPLDTAELGPFDVGHDGIGTIRSRGMLITVACWWSAERWSTIVTSLLPAPELPASSSADENWPP